MSHSELPQGLAEARRLLIVAPHPDDEVVGCALLLARARARGCALSVLFLTHGEPAPAALWPWQRAAQPERVAARLGEAEKALARLGATLAGPWPAWPTRQLRHHLPEARARLRAAIATSDPDAVLVPAFEGAHQDHDATHALAATLTTDTPALWEYAAYSRGSGRPQSTTFFAPRGDETRLLPSPEEAAEKRALLGLYASQRGNLAHIDTAGEHLRRFRPAADYGRPPHPPPLFWSRFHWVPFSHPRIDQTPLAEVYPVLGAFVDDPRSRP
ncbi:PIG-L deacetylase family protein [Roseospirillum parvum]|uniref:N-acetylglucosaminyl deacetylase, LmbE family n=1 Tax=Roseospirillum parvum TaxID=83401 RepID=A0A1G7WAE9_9PROT|nr:PIG-L family deacetylase [Roseospirillum parvum]SDG68809.1 N-acetylglucosaminyl deacetylase, LmbE family [Roseospirillum parvum]